MASIIAHIDLNAFFATAETIRDPSLKGKPILVGHEGRSGIVSTCSYEARKYGCHSGQPTFQALKCCPNAIVVHPNFRLYEILSNSFFAYVRKFTSKVEAASIDECYADFTEVLKNEKDPMQFLSSFQQGLLKETGLPCSIGLGPTKWLAKMASDMKKPLGLTIIRRRDIESIIYPLPIESFWGIGKRSSPKLRQLGINTIGDLAIFIKNDENKASEFFGKFYDTVKDWISGYGQDKLDLEPWDPKSVGHSTTLMHDATSYAEVDRSVKWICREISRQAMEARKVGYVVTVVLKDSAFKTHSKNSTLEYPTNSYEVIYDKASRMLKTFFLKEISVRLVGVTLAKLVNPSRENIQMNLWNYQDYEEQDKTKLLISDLNRKLDKPMLKKASQAIKKK